MLLEARKYSDLPEDIILDILLRQPVKTVGICRCVSKPWQALLSNPKFISTHLQRSKSLRHESILLCSYNYRYIYSTSLKDVFDKISVPKLCYTNSSWPCSNFILAYCDGLFLVKDTDYDVYLLNPITKEFRKIPNSPYTRDTYQCGIGYDSVNDDYKIVTIDSGSHGYWVHCMKMFFNVFSLKTCSWKRYKGSHYFSSCSHYFNPGKNVSDSGVYLNGCIHFLTWRLSDFTRAIVAFDLGEEKLREISTPRVCQGDNLASMDGCLCLFDGLGYDLWEFWVMKDYGVEESWIKFSIKEHNKVSKYTPLCWFGLGHEAAVILDGRILVLYNFKHGTRKELAVFAKDDKTMMELSFVESLVSPGNCIGDQAIGWLGSCSGLNY